MKVRLDSLNGRIADITTEAYTEFPVSHLSRFGIGWSGAGSEKICKHLHFFAVFHIPNALRYFYNLLFLINFYIPHRQARPIFIKINIEPVDFLVIMYTLL